MRSSLALLLRVPQVLTVYYSVGDPVTMLVGQSLAAELALWTLVYFGTPAARPGAPATSAVWSRLQRPLSAARSG